MRILIIDNYHKPESPQIIQLHQAVADIARQSTEVRPYSTVTKESELSRYDAIILSGSQKMLRKPKTWSTFVELVEIIRTTELPVLGICFGHQLIGRSFGSGLNRLGDRLHGYHPIRIVKRDPLFDGLEQEFLATKSHWEIVTVLPADFIHLAASSNVPIEAMRHAKRLLYGVQFHPERHDPDHPAGRKILENFIRMAESVKHHPVCTP
jgi:GMP synthase (glutamine-hydrolysing)